MSSDKRPADNVEASDDGTKLKKPRLSGSTSQEPTTKVSTQTSPRQLPAPYIATLPSSSFSTTLGLEIFPEPSPPPEPIVDRTFGPSSSRPGTSTNPASPVDASREQPSKSLNNGQAAASSGDASGPQLSKSLVNNGKTAPEGFELRIWNKLEQSKLGKIAVQKNPSLVSKDSGAVIEGQVSQVIHRPQNDTPMGIRGDDLQIEVQGNPLLVSKDSRPVIEGETLQVIHRPQNDTPIGIQKDDQQNVENTRGDMLESMQHPPGEALPPVGHVSSAMESSLEKEASQEQKLEQRPRRSPRRIQSQEKKP